MDADQDLLRLATKGKKTMTSLRSIGLYGTVECVACGKTEEVSVPCALDSRDTVVAQIHAVALPPGWVDLDRVLDERWGWRSDGVVCHDCDTKKIAEWSEAEKNELADMEAEKQAEKQAEKEAKKAAKKADKATKKDEKPSKPAKSAKKLAKAAKKASKKSKE